MFCFAFAFAAANNKVCLFLFAAWSVAGHGSMGSGYFAAAAYIHHSNCSACCPSRSACYPLCALYNFCKYCGSTFFYFILFYVLGWLLTYAITHLPAYSLIAWCTRRAILCCVKYMCTAAFLLQPRPTKYMLHLLQ